MVLEDLEVAGPASLFTDITAIEQSSYFALQSEPTRDSTDRRLETIGVTRDGLEIPGFRGQ